MGRDGQTFFGKISPIKTIIVLLQNYVGILFTDLLQQIRKTGDTTCYIVVRVTTIRLIVYN